MLNLSLKKVESILVCVTREGGSERLEEERCAVLGGVVSEVPH